MNNFSVTSCLNTPNHNVNLLEISLLESNWIFIIVTLHYPDWLVNIGSIGTKPVPESFHLAYKPIFFRAASLQSYLWVALVPVKTSYCIVIKLLYIWPWQSMDHVNISLNILHYHGVRSTAKLNWFKEMMISILYFTGPWEMWLWFQMCKF